MNFVKHAFELSDEEYRLRREGKTPKKKLKEFLDELNKENNN